MPSRETPPSGPIDEVVAHKAYYQHGLITNRQLEGLGVTESQTRARVARRQWARVGTGVLRIRGAEVTWESELLAKILSAGKAAMASHRCAAALWRLDGFRRPHAHELVIPRERRVRGLDAIVHQSNDLHLIRPTRQNRVPVTPIERTLIDLGTVCGPTEVLLAADDALRRGLTTWDQLLTVLVRHARRGRVGVPTLRAIIEEHADEVAMADSGFERLVIVLLAAAGLPKPTMQHEVHVDGRVYRLDLAYVGERVAIELNGQVHRERDVWENDQVRYTALTNAGWHVLPFSWRQYVTNSSYIVQQVRLGLAHREPSR